MEGFHQKDFLKQKQMKRVEGRLHQRFGRRLLKNQNFIEYFNQYVEIHIHFIYITLIIIWCRRVGLINKGVLSTKIYYVPKTTYTGIYFYMNFMWKCRSSSSQMSTIKVRYWILHDRKIVYPGIISTIV